MWNIIQDFVILLKGLNALCNGSVQIDYQLHQHVEIYVMKVQCLPFAEYVAVYNY